MRRRLVFALVASLLARRAGADVPAPPNCTCPSVVTLSNGSSCCFDVVIRDNLNNPVPGSLVRITFGGCTVSLCPSPPLTVGSNYVETLTNNFGVAHFCVCGSVTGSCTSVIAADGLVICSVPAQNCAAGTGFAIRGFV